MKTETLESITDAILDASAALEKSSNTRYPFNCTNAAITLDAEGHAYFGSGMVISGDETMLMNEDEMSSAIQPGMSREDADQLAETLMSEME